MHVSSGVCELRNSCLRGCSSEIFWGGLFPPLCHVWSTAPREHPARTAATWWWWGGGGGPENPLGKWARIPELAHTTADHMHHASHIMCVVTVWHPSIGNIIPILDYITLGTPVTVVTSRELQNWNWAAKQNQNLAAIWGLRLLNFFTCWLVSAGWAWKHRTC